MPADGAKEIIYRSWSWVESNGNDIKQCTFIAHSQWHNWFLFQLSKTILFIFCHTQPLKKKHIYFWSDSTLQHCKVNAKGKSWLHILTRGSHLSAAVLTTIVQAVVGATKRATTTWIKAGIIKASLVSFLTWSSTYRGGKGTLAFVTCKFLRRGSKVTKVWWSCGITQLAFFSKNIEHTLSRHFLD